VRIRKVAARPDAHDPAGPARTAARGRESTRASRLRHHRGIDDREQLLRRLRRAGHDEDELQRAAADGRLATLAVESALGGAGRYTLTHVARAAAIDPRFLRSVMQATGRPNPAPREKVFNDEDVEFAGLLRRFLEAGLPREELLEACRVLGQGMSSSADAVRRLVANALLQPGDSEYTLGLRYAQAVDQMGPLVPRILDHQFRAHLRDGIRRELASGAEREAGTLAQTSEVAIAFADLVGYTRLGEQLPAESLGQIAGRLSELAVGATVRPVRLVKMIGDAAMFMSPEVPALVATVAALVQSIDAEGPQFPSIRVGVTYGPATTRGGDWFGTTVNTASRITDLAKPGLIVATEAVVDASPEYSWKRKRRRALKGVESRVRLYALEGPRLHGDR